VIAASSAWRTIVRAINARIAGLLRGENKMSNAYAAVSTLIFALVAVGHVVRLVNRWPVQIGPYNVSMNVSWAALVISALIAI
jgi:hypothetical protein